MRKIAEKLGVEPAEIAEFVPKDYEPPQPPGLTQADLRRQHMRVRSIGGKDRVDGGPPMLGTRIAINSTWLEDEE